MLGKQVKQLIRFGFVGGLSTLLYGLLSYIFVSFLGLALMSSHLLAYAMAIPLSYLGQKIFTFRHNGREKRVFLRFVLTSLGALLVSTLGVHVISDLRWPPITAIFLTMIVVPAFSYMMMKFWVFVDRD